MQLLSILMPLVSGQQRSSSHLCKQRLQQGQDLSLRHNCRSSLTPSRWNPGKQLRLQLPAVLVRLYLLGRMWVLCPLQQLRALLLVV